MASHVDKKQAKYRNMCPNIEYFIEFERLYIKKFNQRLSLAGRHQKCLLLYHVSYQLSSESIVKKY